MKAVIETGGKQYYVEKGTELYLWRTLCRLRSA